MTMQTLLSSLFCYKASADDELLDALQMLDGAEQASELRAAIRVLNHTHIVDRIFRAHLQRLDHPYNANWSPDVPLLAQLSLEIRETDGWYVDYLSGLAPKDLDEIIGFTFTDGKTGRMSRAEMLAHVITHGGYHRGEIGRLLPDIEAAAMRDVFAGYLYRSDPGRRRRQEA